MTENKFVDAQRQQKETLLDRLNDLKTGRITAISSQFNSYSDEGCRQLHFVKAGEVATVSFPKIGLRTRCSYHKPRSGTALYAPSLRMAYQVSKPKDTFAPPKGYSEYWEEVTIGRQSAGGTIGNLHFLFPRTRDQLEKYLMDKTKMTDQDAIDRLVKRIRSKKKPDFDEENIHGGLVYRGNVKSDCVRKVIECVFRVPGIEETGYKEGVYSAEVRGPLDWEGPSVRKRFKERGRFFKELHDSITSASEGKPMAVIVQSLGDCEVVDF